MFSAQIDKIGNSVFIRLTAEMLSVLGVKPGDTLYFSLADDGSLRITANDPLLAVALSEGEAVMEENKDLLGRLR